MDKLMMNYSDKKKYRYIVIVVGTMPKIGLINCDKIAEFVVGNALEIVITLSSTIFSNGFVRVGLSTQECLVKSVPHKPLF